MKDSETGTFIIRIRIRVYVYYTYCHNTFFGKFLLRTYLVFALFHEEVDGPVELIFIFYIPFKVFQEALL